MNRTMKASVLSAVLVLAACSDNPLPSEVVPSPTAKSDFATYVAIGTSVSMGWYNDGVLFSSQDESWTRKLASAAGVSFTAPAISAPGCQPPLAAPLGSFKRTDGSSVATASTVCGDLMAGSSPSSSNLAIENATAVEALNATSTTATKGRGAITSRVLAAGMTQITSMRAKKPTFVSVEFGGNEILPP